MFVMSCQWVSCSEKQEGLGWRRCGRSRLRQPLTERHSVHSANRQPGLEPRQAGPVCVFELWPVCPRAHCHQTQRGVKSRRRIKICAAWCEMRQHCWYAPIVCKSLPFCEAELFWIRRWQFPLGGRLFGLCTVDSQIQTWVARKLFNFNELGHLMLELCCFVTVKFHPWNTIRHFMYHQKASNGMKK